MEKREFRNRLKKVFTGYRHLTAKIEKQLRELGFNIIRHNKHIMLSLVYNQHYFQFALSVTASDYRTGDVMVTKIMKEINKVF